MHSEKAADVRDALNGLPCVAYDPEPSENYPGSDALTITRRGEEWTHTGPCVNTDEFTFSAARIHEAGQISFGKDAPMRPCYEVVLQPLTIPTRPLPSISIPPEVVHEVAKYDCRMRVKAGYRGEWTPGTIHVRDDLAHAQDPDADGDRCPDCRGTRFKLKSGVPECVRCGTRLEDAETEYTPTLGDNA
ncbi:hypothetical protein [Natronosalvus halobius]|uniref:hypothetical protein n=1 Tax=Natronosalvus halobius TaxID=2953746 RepID=UPI00209F1CBA|nr:hypothetical protein [Natronosalvus halobius]USZ73781.1 hypothetical protein NGM15_18415 [Natronosalvus halobius]